MTFAFLWRCRRAALARFVQVPGLTRVIHARVRCLHIRSIHLLQRAIAFTGIVAVVCRPGILKRFEKIGRTDAISLRPEITGATSSRRNQQ